MYTRRWLHFGPMIALVHFKKKWTFLLQSRWTKVKGLYIVTRFVPFLIIIGHLYTNFIPNENPDKCKILINICSIISQISGSCSECFFMLRTYALWKDNRFVLIVMLTFFPVVVIACAGTGLASIVTASYATSAIPGITGCCTSDNLFIPFLLFFIFQLGLMSLTLIHAIQSWRMASGRLYAVLVKNNILYYTCGLFLSAVNVLASYYLHYQYHATFQDFQFIILAILALRMHRHLWQIDQQAHNMDTLVCISLSDI
ncbi:hypothetical protein DFJ58DRAFT_190616 [Suillus subalutaceus]|uniref:uncharacterized protein n=1 Tax=Suillus subalutaceus TaxID=48586 RepID=UPI001B86FD5A|nr:uncharacterized protein DFJ58DRAFT_190616 [Suillus subalutaceus]KAG1836133.1 hypothetical protein DFJ58DRAFT_190616 [Suillus subalutaceus]